MWSCGSDAHILSATIKRLHGTMQLDELLVILFSYNFILDLDKLNINLL